MSTARNILSNLAWQILGKVVTALLSIVILKTITNYLGVAGYGQYTTVYEYLAFFGIAADFGLFTIAVREMAKNSKNIPFIIGNILSLRTITILLTMALAIGSAFLIPQYDNTWIPLGVFIAGLGTALTLLNGTISSVLQVYLKMEISAIATIFGKLVSTGYMLFIVFVALPKISGDTILAQEGFTQLLWAGVIGNLFMLAITWRSCSKLTKLGYRYNAAFMKEMIVKALPYGIALILGTIYFRIDSVILSLLKGPAEVGIYGVPMRILEILTVVPLYFMNAVLPVMTRATESSSEKDRKGRVIPSEKLKTIMQYAFDFLVMLGTPMVVGIVLLAYPITFIIASPEFLSRLSEGFYGSDIAMQILIFALFFSFINTLFTFILIANNKQHLLLWVNGACVIFNIAMNFLWIPIYGFRASAVITVLSEILLLILVLFFVRRTVALRLSLETLIKAVLAAGVMGVIVQLLRAPTYTFLQNWNVFLLAIIGAIVYGILLIVTGAITKEKLALLKRSKTPQPVQEEPIP